MSECCPVQSGKNTKKNNKCPSCREPGKLVKLITLKSLLRPNALEDLVPDQEYYFCSSNNCRMVYFNEQNQTYNKDDLKVPVYQKDMSSDTPICYCFGWTRSRISDEPQQKGKGSSTVVQQITKHIKANRCGCEVNNPQGSCCLGNVTAYVRTIG